jgi:anti-anti-sigma factor
MSHVLTDTQTSYGTPGRVLTDVAPAQTVVRLEGEIDLSMSEDLEHLVLTLPSVTSTVLLDVSGVTFCDATLTGFLAAIANRMPITVTPANPRVVELLRLVGLDEFVPHA